MTSPSTTSTITASEPAKMTSSISHSNPKDSMKSTWRTWEKSRWKFHHWAMDILGIHPTDLDKKVPVHAKTDKLPYLNAYQCHKWILFHGIWPLVAHQLYVYLMGSKLHVVAAIVFYATAFKANAIHEIHEMRKLGHKYGYLDGDKHERDQVPDIRAGPVLWSLAMTATFRPMLCVFMAYFRSEGSPFSTLSWWLPVEIGVYTVLLDFYYYGYHRALHESDSLWKYHRTHHLTKHPSPLLTLYADEVQEIFDMVGIPLLTYATMRLVGLPMGFADFWLCHQYIVWVELWGHSGLRIFLVNPTTASPFLKLFDAELTTEDHDLHHRKGWKVSHNYGKQTRLWDRLFGTCHPRIEALENNIDFSNQVPLPLW